MNDYCVYIHTTPDSKRFVGMTNKNPVERWNYGAGYSSNKAFSEAIKKFKWSKVTHEIVAGNLTKEEAINLRNKLIDEYDTTNPRRGYNNSGSSVYTKEKIRKTSKNTRRVVCVETREHFNCLSDAAAAVGLSRSSKGSIYNACKYGSKAGGRHFKYEDVYEKEKQQKAAEAQALKFRGNIY